MNMSGTKPERLWRKGYKMGLKGRDLRSARIRKRIRGTKEKPRLCMTRSLMHLTAQLIDDIEAKTLFSLSTNSKGIKEKVKSGGNIKAAIAMGEEFAKKAKDAGFSKMVFDRSGYKYHGRIKAFAEACRKGGLQL